MFKPCGWTADKICDRTKAPVPTTAFLLPPSFSAANDHYLLKFAALSGANRTTKLLNQTRVKLNGVPEGQ